TRPDDAYRGPAKGPPGKSGPVCARCPCIHHPRSPPHCQAGGERFHAMKPTFSMCVLLLYGGLALSRFSRRGGTGKACHGGAAMNYNLEGHTNERSHGRRWIMWTKRGSRRSTAAWTSG